MIVVDEEEQRLMDELADRLTDICREYTINQVASATFAVMLHALSENQDASERLYMMNIVVHEMQNRYNTLLHETMQPTESRLH